jgi:curved DNA-binding protein CbpA
VTRNVFQLVLDFQRTPSRFEALIDASQPLPEGTDALLESVASWNQLPPDKLSDVIYADVSREELIKAAVFFVGQILFAPGGDHYRTLALAHNASPEQIRRHYHLLLTFFFLDRKDKAAEWNADYAEHINRAYSILRDPEKRRAYDMRLHNQGDSASRPVDNDDLEYPGLKGVAAGTGYTQPVVSFPSALSRQSSANLIDQKEPRTIHDDLVPDSEVPDSDDEDDSTSDSVGNLAAKKRHTSPPEGMLESDSLIADSIQRTYGALGNRKLSPDEKQVLRNSADNIKATEGHGREKQADSYAVEEITTLPERPIEPIYRKSPATSPLPRTMLTVALIVVIGVAATIYMFRSQPPSNLASRTGMVSGSPAVENKGEISAGQPPSIQMPMTEQNLPMQSFDGNTKQSPSEPREAKPLAATAMGTAPIELADEGKSKFTAQTDGRRDERAKSAVSPEARPSRVGSAAAKSREQLTKRKEKAPVASVAPSGIAIASLDQESRQTVAQKQIADPPVSEVQQVATPPVAKKLDGSTPASVVATTPTSPSAGKVAKLPAMPGKKTITPAMSEGAPSLKSNANKVASPREPVTNSISKEALNKLIAKFIRGYEEGNLGLFISVFAEDARTNDQNNRKGIAEDYRNMFEGTEKRQFIFNGLRWVHEDDAKARGKGSFVVKILPKGEGSINTYAGNITIHVEKRRQTVLITQLYHDYQ